MANPRLTRRHVLVGAVMGTAALAWRRNVRGAPARGAAPAAAAGTVTIGGDLVVNRLGFGAMRITGTGIWGEPKDAREARSVLRRAVELGVNFIDTADAYGPEVSERLIAEALHPYRRGLVIATKGGTLRPGPSEWVADGHPKHLREACEASLRRLKLERIDLYQLHRIDPKVPLADSLGELARMLHEGKIRHVGVSQVSPDELTAARRVMPIVSVQNRYNVADRTSADVLGICEREGLAFIPWAPIASGHAEKLTGGAGSEALDAVAHAHHVSVFQLAIAWLLARSPAMLPIPGTSSVAHLEEDVAAARIKLTPNELAAIG